MCYLKALLVASFLLLQWVKSNDIVQDQHTELGGKLVLVVISQSNDYHAQLAKAFKEDIDDQLTSESKKPRLFFTHTDFYESSGAWSLFPLIQEIMTIHEAQELSWVLVCEDDTHVNVAKLSALLAEYDSSKDVFLGRALHDASSTIIHHFDRVDRGVSMAYPDVRAGFVLSRSLLNSLHQRLSTEKLFTDFAIDPKHEFAKFILKEGEGPALQNIKGFCSSDESMSPDCVTSQRSKFPSCGPAVGKEDLFVAVKTCSKFHDDRVSVVKATWGRETDLIEYYSDVANDSIPTIDLGVPNTERGHCGKTMAIMQRVTMTPRLRQAKWVLIADDDTFIHLGRLRRLLACYNPSQAVALGERYGYGVRRNGRGYDYITMGGGMVLSQPAIEQLVQDCRCASDEAPDDMTLGMCLGRINVPCTHSRFFHQARPNDYSPQFLANQKPVSFHKHWSNDPYQVYADLTKDDDEELSEQESEAHMEL